MSKHVKDSLIKEAKDLKSYSDQMLKSAEEYLEKQRVSEHSAFISEKEGQTVLYSVAEKIGRMRENALKLGSFIHALESGNPHNNADIKRDIKPINLVVPTIKSKSDEDKRACCLANVYSPKTIKKWLSNPPISKKATATGYDVGDYDDYGDNVLL